MSKQFTLSQEAFQNIHNGTCDVRSVLHQLEFVLAPDLLNSLRKAIKRIESGMETVYTQEEEQEEAFRVVMEKFEQENKEALKGSIWSAGIVDFSAEHPYSNIYTMHYGKVFTIIPGKTWGDLWIAASRLIEMSGDSHHVFVEGFGVSAVGNLNLHTGS